ncbi:hypothetical protein F4802DRAFT_594194 [Xylaria palmicola]|nr:hypothetical protein F4802DRAFT_594194 [Xylaria palmicola]
MDQDHIDALLERYLHLLHEYTSLREELTALQTGIYQNIARANFAAERGLRFGRDYYDDRMQASRRLAVSCGGRDQQPQERSEGRERRSPSLLSGAFPSFTVISPASLRAASPSSSAAKDPGVDPEAEAEAKAESVRRNATKATSEEARRALAPSPPPGTGEAQSERIAGSTNSGSGDTPKAKEEEARVIKQKSNDPLHWFGLLTPVPLRQAQAQSIRAVDHVIPRLASVSAEMEEVEIEVRRARKRRAKAEAAAIRLSREGQERGLGTEGGITSTGDMCI